jgi:hypothetical protein
MMGFGDILRGIAKVGGAVAAPLTGGSSLLLPALLGGTAAVGGALSGREGARTTTSTPTLPPEFQSFQDLLRSRIEDRMRSSFDTRGLEATGIQNINDAYRGVGAGLDNSLTARGLATSPVAAAGETDLAMSRAGDIGQWLNQLPQIQRDYQNQDFGQAGALLNSVRGSKTVAPGSAAGGALGSVSEMLAFLAGQGLFGGSKPEAFSF